jgi:4-amino-4-deoxy-L-arabinose transferase-like glycosyltransferase
MLSSLVMELLHRLMHWTAPVSLHVLLSLNVIYVSIGESCGLAILRRFGVRGRNLVTAVFFLFYFPGFYLLCGAMDGSALAFMFSMLALSGVLSWYDSRRQQVLLRSALYLGLGFMTSYTTVVVVPAIMVILYSAAKDRRRNRVPFLKQLTRFVVIVLVMSLIWPIYLSVRFHLPLFYVEKIGATVPAAYSSVFHRLGIPDLQQLLHLHTHGHLIPKNLPYECNIWAQTFKTAVVDFHTIDTSAKGTYVMTVFLLFLTISICLLMHVMMLYSIFGAGRIHRVHKKVLLIGYFSVLAGYIATCFILPWTGTMHFRWYTAIQIFPMVGMGVCGSRDSTDNLFEKITTRIGDLLIIVMAVLTAFVFNYYP